MPDFPDDFRLDPEYDPFAESKRNEAYWDEMADILYEEAKERRAEWNSEV